MRTKHWSNDRVIPPFTLPLPDPPLMIWEKAEDCEMISQQEEDKAMAVIEDNAAIYY